MNEVEAAIAEADAWLNSHKVTDTWRTMNRLRDTLVRHAGASPESFHPSSHRLGRERAGFRYCMERNCNHAEEA